MTASETGLVPRSELSGHKPSTDIAAEYTVLKDQILPTKNNHYPPRTSSLPSPPSSSRTSLSGAGRYEWLFRTSGSVGQTQMTRMFQRAKKRFAALFSPKQTPPPDEPPTPESTYASDLCQRRRAELIPVPGRPNKFWIRPPSQRTKDRAERKMLRRMSPRARERWSVTAESTKKMLKLEEERIAVRDFQPEHDAVREKMKKEVEEEEAKMGAQLEDQD